MKLDDSGLKVAPDVLPSATALEQWSFRSRPTRRLVFLALMGTLLVSATALGDAPSPTSTDRTGATNAASPGGLLDVMTFYVVAAGAVVSSLGVCLSKNIVRMAVWLFVALGSVALMYFLLAANFLGAIQLIVYAGGTLVLLIFGVMLTSKSPWVRFEPRAREIVMAAVVCLGLLASLGFILVRTSWHSAQGIVPGAALADLGRRLLTVYLVPFEVTGVLLFIVMVGAAHLARQERISDEARS